MIMNEKNKARIIKTIGEREKLRPLGRLERLLRDPLRAFPFYILATLGHIRPLKVTFETLWGDSMTGYLPETNTFYYYGFCEANLTSFLLRFLKEKDIFIDVGANIGFYTVLASRLIGPEGKVRSFEPTPLTFEILKENTRMLENAVCNNIGVSDENGKISFKDFGPGYSAFNTASAEGTILRHSSKNIEVPSITLDRYINEQDLLPTFIKLDAEGLEYKILQGMKEILSRSDRALVTIEMANDGLWADNYKSSSDVLLKAGFKAYEMKDDGMIIPCEIRERYTYTNILFVPPEKEFRIKELKLS